MTTAEESRTEPGRVRPNRRWGTAVGACIAGLIVVLWGAVGPGPYFEEHYISIFFAVLVGLCAFVSAIADPRPVLAPPLYTGIWLVGYLVACARIALAYDCPFWDPGAFAFGFEVAIVLLAVSVIIHLALLVVHALLRGLR